MTQRTLAGWASEFALGFAYWLALVVVLEPGNVLRGATLPLGMEAARLAGAGLLGAAITPAVFALTRHRPIEGEARWRRAALHLGCDLCLAALLIVAAGVLAALFGLDRRPLPVALADQLAIDGLLLFFAVAALTGIAHALLFQARAQSAGSAPPAPAAGYLAAVPVRTRGRVLLLDLAQVGWIESQGNYLALHDGAASHLIRETSVRFETLLDPARFARIHRQTIVALDRIREIASLPSGDATVTLDDGTRLRMSRGFRDGVRKQFEARQR
ncbi:MAG TPA: LytTR family DNA-binding domain-containing protein [Rhizomicrobium sp.]|jgi:hypothetical protein|nr:LytTR family DNA-binding domain-containing protein [Rhizomicrobium sp.]